MKNLLITRPYYGITSAIKRKPLSSFFVTLGLLFLIIIIGHSINQPKPQKPVQTIVKDVTLFSIGEASKATDHAKIEKAGVIKIMAQTSGIVQKVNVKEGTTVKKGKQLLTLSSNYQGGNTPAVQASIAQKQYQNVLD